MKMFQGSVLFVDRKLRFVMLLTGVLLSFSSLVNAAWPLGSEAGAETLLLVRATMPDYATGQQTKFDAQQYAVYKETQAVLVKSRLVLNAALGKPGINELASVRAQDDPLAWLLEVVSVEFIGDSEVMRIRLSYKDAQEARQLVKAIQEAYMDEIVFSQRKEVLVRSDILKRTYRQKIVELSEKRHELWQLEEQIGTDASMQARISRELATEALRSILRREARLEERLDEIELEIGLLTPEDDQEKDEEADVDAFPDAAALKMLAKEQKLIRAKLAELGELQKEAEQELRLMGGRSAAVEARQEEIQALAESAAMLRRQIDALELNLQREPSVQVVQPPVVVP
jgi:succinoglycan biosynthesis transport protein ExoP